jgi:tetratricopeptide (TPR) repeat protein
MSRYRLIVLAAVAGTALAAAGAGIWWYRAGPPPPPVDLSGRDPEVVAAVEKARAQVQQEPHSGKAWGELGMVLQANDFPAEAETCLAQAERLDPKEALWPYLHGRLVQLRDPEQALPLLRRAATLDRRHTVARLHLAESLLELGHDDEAMTQFQQVLATDPDNPRAHLGWGRVAYQQGDLDRSLEHLRRAEEAVPQLRPTHAVLAEIYRRKGDRQAQQHELGLLAASKDLEWPDPYQLGVEKRKAGGSGRVAEALALVDEGRQAEAIKVLEQAVRDYPKSYRVRLILARQLTLRGDLAGAASHLRTALQLRPDAFEALSGLGEVLQGQHNYKEAVKCYERIIALQPTHADAHLQLANCRNELGDRAGAVESLREGIRCRPEFGPARRVLGRLLADMGQNAEAAEQLQQALRLDPGDTEARELLDRVRAKLPQAKDKR